MAQQLTTGNEYQAHFLSYSISQETFESNQCLVKKKMCYNNIYNILSQDDNTQELVRQKKWTVCYGAMEAVVGSNVYVRHCFFKTNQDGIIDPTVFLLDKHDFDNTTYFIAKEYDFNSYIEALIESNGEPSLFHELLDSFKELDIYLYSKYNAICLG